MNEILIWRLRFLNDLNPSNLAKMISFDFQNGICAWNRDNVPNCLMHLTTQPPTTVATTLQTTITETAVNECPALLGQENYECTHKTFTHNVVCKMKCPGQIFRKVCKCTDSGCDWNRLTVRVSNNKKENYFLKIFLAQLNLVSDFSLIFSPHLSWSKPCWNNFVNRSLS